VSSRPSAASASSVTGASALGGKVYWRRPRHFLLVVHKNRLPFLVVNQYALQFGDTFRNLHHNKQPQPIFAAHLWTILPRKIYQIMYR